MLYKKIDLKQINTFISVYEEKHISAAAKKLNLSQSSVTQQIKSLERNTNFLLFNRTPHGVVPTEEGELFYNRIIGNFKQFSHAILELETHHKIRKNQINIAAHYPFIIYELPQILSKLKDIPVKIHNISKQDAEVKMLTGEIDICIYPVFDKNEKFFYHNLQAYKPTLITYKYNKISMVDKIMPQDLQGQNFITIDKDLITLEGFNKLYDEFSFNTAIHFEHGNWDMLMAMVQQDLGIALVNGIVINRKYEDITYKDMSHIFPKTTYQTYIANLLLMQNTLVKDIIKEISQEFHDELCSFIQTS